MVRPQVGPVPARFHVISLCDWYTSPNVFVLIGRTLICRGHGVKVGVRPNGDSPQWCVLLKQWGNAVNRGNGERVG